MAIGAISSQRAKHVSPAVSSSITKVGAYWSPGQGMVRPGDPARQWGLYVTGSVKQNHNLTVEHVKREPAKKTVTITLGAPGHGAAGKKTESKQAFVGGGFSMQAQKWTVVVKDEKGHSLLKKQMMLGGPPAP